MVVVVGARMATIPRYPQGVALQRLVPVIRGGRGRSDLGGPN